MKLLLVPILIRPSPETPLNQPKLAHVSSVTNFVLCPLALISSSTTVFNSKMKIRLVLYNTAASLPALIDDEIVGSRVLSGISLFVVEILHETTISRRNRGAQKRSNLVNPVISRKPSPGNRRAETSHRVQRPASTIPSQSLIPTHHLTEKE